MNRPTGGAGRAAELPPICILAGGLGTRLGERVRQTPKPLLEVAGEPFLLHQLRLLARHGAREVVLCIGYRGEQIESQIGRDRFGIRIQYSFDTPELDGTLGAIRRALPLLGARFLVLYGDTYLRLDYAEVDRVWCESGLPAMMSVLRNEGRWDTSNVCYAGERVLSYDKRAPTPDMQWIDYGLGGLTADALSAVDAAEGELAALYGRLAEEGRLFGYEASERFYEIGTPSGLAEADAFLRGLNAAS
ncbi:MAG TPA: NTP transferase domain-containing protein [Solirubrobacteraceae bacterium]|jgi:NDP-sugar pyrophosphorylase family protein|nr:NTP transferase domain-containing protein [Solirubrobacteraceae bacterium]